LTLALLDEQLAHRLGLFRLVAAALEHLLLELVRPALSARLRPLTLSSASSAFSLVAAVSVSPAFTLPSASSAMALRSANCLSNFSLTSLASFSTSIASPVPSFGFSKAMRGPSCDAASQAIPPARAPWSFSSS
jgi:hypothetical protein